MDHLLPLYCPCRSFEMAREYLAILTDFYLVTHGDRWKNNSGWCTDAPLSQWHGVTIDPQGRVIGLNLRHNNLTGEENKIGKLVRYNFHR